MLRFRQYFIHLSLRFKNFCFVGEDAYGNRYYGKIFSKKEEKKREKRIVIYHGSPEATNIPPEWYRWMHFTSQESPLNQPFSGGRKRSSPSLGAAISKRQVSLASSFNPQNCSYVPWVPNGEVKKAQEII